MGFWAESTGGEKFGAGVVLLGTAVVSYYLGDQNDFIEKDDRLANANTVNITGTLPGSVVDANGVEVSFDNIPGLTCTGPDVPIVVDARADIGATTSLLKAIEVNRPGSQATEMNASTVYALARAVAVLNNHSELVSYVQLDDFPYGTYNIPTGCSTTSTKGTPIVAIT